MNAGMDELRVGPPERKGEQPALGDRVAIAAPVIAAPGASKRFSLEVGKSVELTQRGIILSVRDQICSETASVCGLRDAGAGGALGRNSPWHHMKGEVAD